MAEYRRSEIVSGAFILLALLGFSLFAFKVGGLDLFAWARAKTTACVTFFPDVKTLEVGVKVSIGGQRVGRVMAISLATSGEAEAFWTSLPEDLMAVWRRGDRNAQVLKVEFELERRENLVLDLPAARVALVQDGLLGTHFLRLDPGDLRRGRPAHELPQPVVLRPASGGGLDELMAEAPVLIRKINEILDSVKDEVLSAANREALKNILANLDGLVVDTRRFTGELPHYVDPNDDRSVDKKVLDPAKNLLTNANQKIDDLGNRLQQTTLTEVENLLKDGRAAVEEARKVLKTADDLLVQAKPKVQGILDDLKKTTAELDGRLNALQTDAQKLMARADELVGNVNGAVSENRPELAELLQSLRRLSWEAEIFARKIRANPAVLLWGDSEPVLDAAPVDESTLRRAGRARPFGVREEGHDQK